MKRPTVNDVLMVSLDDAQQWKDVDDQEADSDLAEDLEYAFSAIQSYFGLLEATQGMDRDTTFFVDAIQDPDYMFLRYVQHRPRRHLPTLSYVTKAPDSQVDLVFEILTDTYSLAKKAINKSTKPSRSNVHLVALALSDQLISHAKLHGKKVDLGSAASDAIRIAFDGLHKSRTREEMIHVAAGADNIITSVVHDLTLVKGNPQAGISSDWLDPLDMLDEAFRDRFFDTMVAADTSPDIPVRSLMTSEAMLRSVANLWAEATAVARGPLRDLCAARGAQMAFTADRARNSQHGRFGPNRTTVGDFVSIDLRSPIAETDAGRRLDL